MKPINKSQENLVDKDQVDNDLQAIIDDTKLYIDEKINEGSIDAQALPLIYKWYDEIYLYVKYKNELRSHKHNKQTIKQQAEKYARIIVDDTRNEREENIKNEYKSIDEKAKLQEKKNIEKQNERTDTKQTIKTRKLQMKESKHQRNKVLKDIENKKKIQNKQKELHDQEYQTKLDLIKEDEEIQRKLEEVAKKNMEASNDYIKTQNELTQKEKEAEMQRIKTNNKLTKDIESITKDAENVQKQMDLKYKQQNEAIKAKYEEQITKSKRETEENLKKIDEIRYERIQNEINNKSKYANIADTIKRNAKNAVWKNSFGSAYNDSTDINEIYEKEKQNWKSVHDVDKTINLLNDFYSKTNNDNQKNIIKNKIKAAKSAKTKMSKNNN